MALRDFERVRERIEFRLEIRHIAQIAVAALLMLAMAFGAGWCWASSSTPMPTEAPKQLARIQAPDLPAPHLNLAQRRSPILPKSLAARSARQPKLARVIEAIARHEPLPSATAAQHQDEPVHSEEDETPFEHVAVERAVPEHRKEAPRRPVAVVTGAMVDASPESPTLHAPEGWVDIPLRPAELVQSQPMRPVDQVTSLDPERQQRLEPGSLYLTAGIGPDGAALSTPLDAGGETHNIAMITPMSSADIRALRSWKLAERRAVLERIARQEADKQRLAELKAEQERLALEKAEQERLAAERAKQERLAAEEAEIRRIAAEKAARLAQQKRIAAEKVEQARLAALRLKQERAAKQKSDAARLAAMKSERQRLARQKAARMAEAARLAKVAKAEAVVRAKALAATGVKDPLRAKAAPTNERSFYLQIKAFRNLPEARVFVKLLINRGHKPRISRTTVPGRGEFHRVRIGPFKSIDAAKAAQRRFEAREPYETMVMSR